MLHEGVRPDKDSFAYEMFSERLPQGGYSGVLLCEASSIGNLRYREIPGRGYYISSTTNPVIELSRAFYNPSTNRLISGRLWFEPKYWDKTESGEDVLVTKDKSLESLYESLAGWLRKHYAKLPNDNLIGPHAHELLKAGAELSPAM